MSIDPVDARVCLRALYDSHIHRVRAQFVTVTCSQRRERERLEHLGQQTLFLNEFYLFFLNEQQKIAS